jgi:hypothetical protein
MIEGAALKHIRFINYGKNAVLPAMASEDAESFGRASANESELSSLTAWVNQLKLTG